jgi:hypothetical protein
MSVCPRSQNNLPGSPSGGCNFRRACGVRACPGAGGVDPGARATPGRAWPHVLGDRQSFRSPVEGILRLPDPGRPRHDPQVRRLVVGPRTGSGKPEAARTAYAWAVGRTSISMPAFGRRTRRRFAFWRRSVSSWSTVSSTEPECVRSIGCRCGLTIPTGQLSRLTLPAEGSPVSRARRERPTGSCGRGMQR